MVRVSRPDEAAQPAASATQAPTPKSLRRSKRIETMVSSHHNGTTAQCTAHTSPTQTPLPVAQSRHSLPRAARKRRPLEPLHMKLRGPMARQRTAQTAQPSLQHAHVTESARHSSKASPHSSSGLPLTGSKLLCVLLWLSWVFVNVCAGGVTGAAQRERRIGKPA